MRLQSREAQEFRLQQITALDEKGCSQNETAEIINCSQFWVSKVIKRAREDGKENVRLNPD